MARYENIVVISPDCTKEEEEELLKRITATLEKNGASVVQTDDWGVRRLAYQIKKKDKGHYFFFILDMNEEGVGPLNKFYKTVDMILRHMFVRVEDGKLAPEKPPEHVAFDELEGEYS